MNNVFRLFLGGFLLVFLTQPGLAQLSVPAQVLGNGAATMVEGDLKIAGTIGQPVVTLTTGSPLRVHPGFWTTRTAAKVTDIEYPEPAEVLTLQLAQNYPNPFTDETIISFALPEASDVALEVYDALGRRIETLVNKTMVSGNHRVVFNASHLPGGIYFYRLQTGETLLTMPMNLVR